MMMLLSPGAAAGGGGGGATFTNNFESYGVAAATPSGWTERHNQSDYSTVSAGSGIALQVVNAFQQRSTLSMNAVDGEATRDYFDILAKYRCSTITAGVTGGGVIARAAGAAGSESGYACVTFGDALRIVYYGTGTANVVATSASKGLTANTWYWIRFRIDNNGAGPMRARIWADGGGEPGTWDVTGTAGADIAAGWAGPFSFSQATHQWDYFSIGCNGTAAP